MSGDIESCLAMQMALEAEILKNGQIISASKYAEMAASAAQNTCDAKRQCCGERLKRCEDDKKCKEDLQKCQNPEPEPPKPQPPPPKPEPPKLPPTNPGPAPVNPGKPCGFDFSNYFTTDYCSLPNEQQPRPMMPDNGDLDCNDCLAPASDLYDKAHAKCNWVRPPQRFRNNIYGWPDCKTKIPQPQIDKRDAVISSRIPRYPTGVGYNWTDRLRSSWECTELYKADLWRDAQPESAAINLKMNSTAGITQETVDLIKKKYDLDVDKNKGTNQLDWVLNVNNPKPPKDWNPPSNWQSWLATMKMKNDKYYQEILKMPPTYKPGIS